jgi:predicted ABC-type ATPase
LIFCFFLLSLHSEDHQRYTIALILTDGRNGDDESTIQALIKASHLPISIIFIGIGNSDFADFQKYTVPDLTLREERAARQAVSFFKFNDLNTQRNIQETVLKEIPEQFLQFMKMNRIHPK